MSRRPVLAILLLPLLAAMLLPLLPGVSPGFAAPSPRTAACVSGTASRTLNDQVRDAPAGIDIGRLGIWNKDRNSCVWTTAEGRFSARRANVLQVLFDTDRSRPGAEFYAVSYSPRDGDQRRGTHLVGRFGNQWRYVECEVPRFYRIADGQIGLGVPRRCLGDPGHVKVIAQVWRVDRYRPGNSWIGKVDKTPSGRWSPLV